MPLASGGDLQGVLLVPTGYRQNQTKFVMGYNTVRKCFYSEISRQDIRDYEIITWRGGLGNWHNKAQKLSRTPLLLSKKLTLTSPHLLIILRSTPLPCSLVPPPIGSLIPNLRVGYLSQAQKVLQMTLQMTLLNNRIVNIFT